MAFQIHAVSVSEGTLGLCPLPGADGDYKEDIATISGWKPSLVITLVSEDELERHGAPNLGFDLQSTGTRWAHVPIVDFGVPGVQFQRDWVSVSENARHALTGGGRVLVHCRGGCGRAGMVALRLMVEMGENAKDALARLRAVRPCAIETDEQLSWSVAAKPIPATFLRHPEGK